MSYTYTPPSWRNTAIIQGSLRYSVPTSYCVYRKAGVWYSVITPGVGDLTGFDTDPSGLVLIFDRGPVVIPDSLQPELAAFGIGTLSAHF